MLGTEALRRAKGIHKNRIYQGHSQQRTDFYCRNQKNKLSTLRKGLILQRRNRFNREVI